MGGKVYGKVCSALEAKGSRERISGDSTRDIRYHTATTRNQILYPRRNQEPDFTIYCRFCQEQILLQYGIVLIKEGVFHPNCYKQYQRELWLTIEEKIEENREATLRRNGAI